MKVEDLELFAWVGEDELGSGEIGLKQGRVPAGLIPLVAIKAHEEKLRRLQPQLEAQAAASGKKIYLCRFVFAEIVEKTDAPQNAVVDVRDATHVETLDGETERIVSKWGIGPEGQLAKPSEGGFGVVTQSGRRVTMWEAKRYLRLGAPESDR